MEEEVAVSRSHLSLLEAVEVHGGGAVLVEVPAVVVAVD
jgi:hypothetical protein